MRYTEIRLSRVVVERHDMENRVTVSALTRITGAARDDARQRPRRCLSSAVSSFPAPRVRFSRSLSKQTMLTVGLTQGCFVEPDACYTAVHRPSMRALAASGRFVLCAAAGSARPASDADGARRLERGGGVWGVMTRAVREHAHGPLQHAYHPVHRNHSYASQAEEAKPTIRFFMETRLAPILKARTSLPFARLRNTSTALLLFGNTF